ncbi:MAG: YggT family protein [Gammaproteobacteria bacterium]|nr:YggT family protein [Gammaproteobacteria bacterium]MBU1414562.1 YggT family protein [Gammaproteobacteria bacterium]
MLLSIFTLVVGTVSDLLAFVFLARFAMQWARVPFRNPLGRFVLALTDWAVLPARKLVPGLFGLDLASFLLAWLVQALFMSVVIGISGMHGGATAAGFGVAIMAGLVETVRLAIYLAMAVVIVSALLSWINPYAPVAPLFAQLAEPLLRPFRRVIPPIGGVDLSPLGVLLLLQVGLLMLGQVRVALLPFYGS